MFKNTLRTALRFFWRQKAYTLLNVLGLGVGLACSFFILLWIQDEVRYDRFHEHGDRIHQVMRHYYPTDGKVFTWPSIPYPAEAVLGSDYPEITRTVMVSWDQDALLSDEDTAFRLNGRYAGPAFFDVFTFPFLAGDPATALDDPSSVVISETVAARFFGSDWQAEGVVGQTLKVEDRKAFTISGVYADVPATSTLQFDFVLPMEDYTARNEWVHHWGNSGLRMFVRLHEEADPETVSTAIAGVIRANHDDANTDLFLHPFTSARLYSNFENGELSGGRIEYVRMFAVVALLILLIASINFMNLSTARSSQRAREIGVRKAVGATRQSLAGQFLAESVALALAAFVLAVAAVALGLGPFNALTGKDVALAAVFSPATLGLFAAIAVVTGLIAGSYPALDLSSFGVARVLRGGVGEQKGAAGFRRGLVVFQFAMSILLIVGTMTVYRQIDYIQSKNLGLDRENLVTLRLEGGIQERYETFRAELLRTPGVAAVSISNQNPLSVGNSTTDPTWDGKAPDSQILFSIINAGHDFVETMRMQMARGRPFSRDLATDTANYVVNQAAVAAMGMDQPVGQTLTFWEQTGEIVGVVEDFHMTSLYAPIEPTIIRLDPEQAWLLFVRTEPGATEAAVAGLRSLYATFNPGYPFEYEFLDDTFAETYESEMVIGTLARVFTLLALFVACLGLFGLAAYAAERRTREIGIRKTLGASIPNVVLLLSADFIKLVGIAFVVAVPVAYVVAEHWLSQFAYRTDVGLGLFLLAGAAALLVAALTVGLQATRAALLDPVKALRRE